MIDTRSVRDFGLEMASLPLRALSSALSLLVCVAPASTDVTFSDEVFEDADWSAVTVTASNGGALVSAIQVNPGGNPDEYRQVKLTANAYSPPVTQSGVWTYHFRSGATVDPGSLGGISSIDFSLDGKCEVGAAGCQVVGPAIRQDGVIYLVRPGMSIPEFSWTSKPFFDLTDSDFCVLDPLSHCSAATAQHPDFSCLGGVIEFGFYLSMTGQPATTTRTVGVDSWATVVRSPQDPENYCTSGISAGGCQAILSAVGTASATVVSGFDISVVGVEGEKDGLFFFGANGRQSNSWGNGTSYQCVVPPVVRGGLLTGTGTSGSCNGTFSQDLNTLWAAIPAKNPGAGALVQAQLWYRDPLNTSNQTTSLSDAIEFCVGP